MRIPAIFLLLMLGAAWLLGGCGSDSTAPDDSLPPLSDEDVADQSGFMAVALVQVAPLGLDYGGKAADVGDYTYTFPGGGEVQGTVYLQFRDGGATGDPVAYGQADWARAYTAGDEPLTIDLIEGGIPWILAFELFSDLNRATDSALVNGGGSLVIGDYTATWTVEDLQINGAQQWPASGTLTFTNEGITAVVRFNGTSTVTVEVGESSFDIDLDALS